jgi:uncharacterized protein (TIGR00369 family)
MDTSVPAGFEPIDLGIGFTAPFGPVYLNRETMTLGFRVREYHINPVQGCNGGAMATFADMQIAAVFLTREGRAPKTHLPTISLAVDYLAPAPLGAWVEAAVTLIKITKTLIFTQALITVEGQSVARSNATYRNYYL